MRRAEQFLGCPGVEYIAKAYKNRVFAEPSANEG
jgi:hypothetical protein